MVTIARQHFHLPDNDQRLQVVQGDGLDYLRLQAQEATNPQPDIIMLDVFDGFGVPPDFYSQAFFDDCAAVLSEQGMVVINLWGSDKNFAIYWQRLQTSFGGKLLKLPTGKPGNIVVFAFNGLEYSLTLDNLLARAKELLEYDQVDYTAYVETLFDHNPHLQQQFTFTLD